MPAKAGIHSNQLMDSRALGAPGGNDSINNLLYSVLISKRGELMILGLGCACLLAFGFAAAPRLFLIIGWIWGDRWDIVWQGNWFLPLIGIIFLPYTTVMFMLVWMPGGLDFWGWLWVGLGVLLDVMKWGSIYEQRRDIPYVSQYSGAA